MFGRLLLTAILATTLASAQSRGGGGGVGGGDDMGGAGGMGGSGMGGGGMGGGIPRVQRQSKAEMFADRLKLNKDQKDEVQTLLNAALKEAAPVREQIAKGRVVITDAILGGKSQDDIKKLLDTYATVSAQMAGIEAKTFTKVCAMLKPNQQSKAASAFELMAGMFDPPPAGGGRMGGGRMGGARGGRN